MQPATDTADLWDSPPFEPEIRGGRLWGRGASDDKGSGVLPPIQVPGVQCCVAPLAALALLPSDAAAAANLRVFNRSASRTSCPPGAARPPPQALEAALSASKGSLPLNVKVILEGEEEVRAGRLPGGGGRCGAGAGCREHPRLVEARPWALPTRPRPSAARALLPPAARWAAPSWSRS